MVVKYGDSEGNKVLSERSSKSIESDESYKFIEEDIIGANAVDIENNIEVDKEGVRCLANLEELCNIPNDNEVEPTSEETCILSSAIGRDELEQETKQEELMKVIYEKEKRVMEKILKKVETSSCNEEEAFSHQLQLVIKDSISKYFQSVSGGAGGTTSSSSEEGQCSGTMARLKLSLPLRLQLKNNWHQCKEGQCSGTMARLKLSLPWRLQLKNNWHQCKEEPVIDEVKPAASDRLEMELPMMVVC